MIHFTALFSLGLFALVAVFPTAVSADWINPRTDLFDGPSRTLVPYFPRCDHVRGDVRASYEYGWHAIVGKDGVYEGSDTVYDIEYDNAVQCFCPKIGMNGVQTNWLSVKNVSSETKDFLKSLGWYWIPDGKSWGLAEGGYLAQNIEYLCVR